MPIPNPYNQYALPLFNHDPYGYLQNKAPLQPSFETQLLDFILKQRKGDSEDADSEFKKITARQTEMLQKLTSKFKAIEEKKKHEQELQSLQKEALELQQQIESARKQSHRNLQPLDTYGDNLDDDDHPLHHQYGFSSAHNSPTFGTPRTHISKIAKFKESHSHNPSPRKHYDHLHSPQQLSKKGISNQSSALKQQTTPSKSHGSSEKLPYLYPNFYSHIHSSPRIEYFSHGNDKGAKNSKGSSALKFKLVQGPDNKKIKDVIGKEQKESAKKEPNGTNSNSKKEKVKVSPKTAANPQNDDEDDEDDEEDEEEDEEGELPDLDVRTLIYKPKKKKPKQTMPANLQKIMDLMKPQQPKQQAKPQKPIGF